MTDSITQRRITSIHEAAHAVTSYLLGVPFLRVMILDDSRGEVVPESADFQTRLNYYESHDPATDAHSKSIQDDLRKSAAIAVAGEIGEECLLGSCDASPAELDKDRQIARSRASAVHLWASTDCYLGTLVPSKPCLDCDGFLDALRPAVRVILTQSAVSNAIEKLATRLGTQPRMTGPEAEHLLVTLGIQQGSVAAGSLPAAPP